MNPSGWARLRVVLVIAVALVVQTTFGSDLRVERVAPDFLLLVAVCAGIEGGAFAGAVIGFVAGLLADLTLTATPVGLSALAWCLTGWAVGQLRAVLLPQTRLLHPVIGFAACAGGVVVFLLAAGLAGESIVTSLGRHWLTRVALVEGVWGAVLVVPVAAAVRWALRGLAALERPTRPDLLAGR